MTTKSRGKNLNYIRSSNLGSIIRILLVNGPTSRQVLAQKLHLTKMSITYLVNELLDKNIVMEKQADDKDVRQNNPGRKPMLLFLQPDSIYTIGVNITRRSLCCSISDIVGKVARKITVSHDIRTTKQRLNETISANIQELLNEFADKRVIGIGISCTGLVDTRSGSIVATTDFYGIADWNIRDILEKQFALPVLVVEDMKAAALAESYYGIARGLTDFVYFGVTYGIGAGVIINEKPFEGHRGFSGEIGHCSINHRGKKCACGNTGCMELYLSVPVLLKNSGLKTWPEFLAMCDDDVANPTLEQFISNMGVALTNVINIFDPQAIVIGQEGAMLNHYCFEKMQILVDNSAITRRFKKVQILPSGLKENVPCLGPSSVIFLNLFQGNIQL